MSSRRVTREQVEDVLLWTGPYADPTIQNICRDWLDMAAREAEQSRLGVAGVQELIDTRNRLAAAEAVVAAARRVVDAGTGRPMTVFECARLMDALDALDAEGRGGEGVS